MDGGTEDTRRILQEHLENAGWEAKRLLEGMDHAEDFYKTRAAGEGFRNGRTDVLLYWEMQPSQLLVLGQVLLSRVLTYWRESCRRNGAAVMFRKLWTNTRRSFAHCMQNGRTCTRFSTNFISTDCLRPGVKKLIA